VTTVDDGVSGVLPNARLGSAPDSWGVWFPDSEQQTTPQRFLDEIAEAGYRYLELGPWGYLPTDPAVLAEELSSRALTLSGGTVGGSLHQAGAYEAVCAEAHQVAALVAAMGARYLIFLPGMYRDLLSGDHLEASELDNEGWTRLITDVQRLGREILDEHGVKLVFHPHADSHVETQAQTERFLDETDPATVGLCLDTGHIAYTAGDNAAIIDRYPERIEYLHFKQVDPAVLDVIKTRDLAFAAGVGLGVTCEPPLGVPAMQSLTTALGKLPDDIHVIVEQDMFPCPPDQPLPIARRTETYLRKCGIGSLR
jgi:inosose dehydratase